MGSSSGPVESLNRNWIQPPEEEKRTRLREIGNLTSWQMVIRRQQQQHIWKRTQH